MKTKFLSLLIIMTMALSLLSGITVSAVQATVVYKFGDPAKQSLSDVSKTDNYASFSDQTGVTYPSSTTSNVANTIASANTGATGNPSFVSYSNALTFPFENGTSGSRYMHIIGAGWSRIYWNGPTFTSAENTTTTDYVIESKVRPNQTTGAVHISMAFNGNCWHNQMISFTKDGTIRSLTTGGAWSASLGTYNANQWYKVTIIVHTNKSTTDNATYDLYLDGKLLNSTPFPLGTNTASTYPANGGALTLKPFTTLNTITWQSYSGNSDWDDYRVARITDGSNSSDATITSSLGTVNNTPGAVPSISFSSATTIGQLKGSITINPDSTYKIFDFAGNDITNGNDSYNINNEMTVEVTAPNTITKRVYKISLSGSSVPITVNAKTNVATPASSDFVSLNFVNTQTAAWNNTYSQNFIFNANGSAGCYGEITFVGTDIELIGYTESVSGNIDVLIDGVAAPGTSNGKVVIPRTTTATANQSLYKVIGLNYGQHVLRFTVRSDYGSGANYFELSKFVFSTMSDASAIKTTSESMTDTSILGQNATLNFIVNPLNLIQSGVGGATVSWNASPSGIVNTSTGEVTRGETDVPVTLTATITKGSEIPYTKQFSILVKNLNITDSESIFADISMITEKSVLSNNSDVNNITTSLNLPKSGGNGTSFAWNTDVSGVIDTDTGNVTRSYDNDVTVVLTVTATKGTATSQQKGFTLVVKYYPYLAQSGANPIQFEPVVSKIKDNIVSLMAAGARHSSNLVVSNYGDPKHC